MISANCVFCAASQADSHFCQLRETLIQPPRDAVDARRRHERPLNRSIQVRRAKGFSNEHAVLAQLARNRFSVGVRRPTGSFLRYGPEGSTTWHSFQALTILNSGRRAAACSWPSVPIDRARYEEARGLHGFRVAHRVIQAAGIDPEILSMALSAPPSLTAHPMASSAVAFEFLDRTDDLVLIHGCAFLAHRRDA